MLEEVSEGGFNAFSNKVDIFDYRTEAVSSSEPWGVYSIMTDYQNQPYIGVFAAASQYKASFPIISSSSNTARKVPVTANSHRERESHVFHIELNYSSADNRAFISSVIETLKFLSDKVPFEVMLPTGRLVTVTFSNIDDTWPFEFGKVIVIIQAIEYNPFPIESSTNIVNKKNNAVNANDGDVAGQAKKTSLTAEIEENTDGDS